ncbi:hypothetical protein M409DRAFT_30969 [Zasmidium cellare ATCC 36951]|uniref:Uncharacterized protein n=1 Tax=Zasmidium cellare ATCC 36951 TaxID=1080233 RepID=A0A6A6BY98_ZASCE|nr:uncharacterized protein M409DRAFT_30969 [Zasmidium cellare ATCC 36951]KAF2158532.1 hypothetical protein M409DRAFT_30969 [Zasmidium cellare ATCC 36951]
MDSATGQKRTQTKSEEQLGILSPLGTRKNRPGSISSQLSSPLDGCRDEEEEKASKAFWREKWEKWEERAGAEADEGEGQGGSRKVVDGLDLGELSIAQEEVQPQRGPQSSTVGEHDTRAAAFDGSSHGAAATTTNFLQLTPERPAHTKNASTTTTTEEEIIDSYAESDAVLNSAILYSARAKLSLALVLREKLHDEEISSELTGNIKGITSDLEDMRTAVEGARQQVDGERAGVVRGLLRRMRVEVKREIWREGKAKVRGG